MDLRNEIENILMDNFNDGNFDKANEEILNLLSVVRSAFLVQHKDTLINHGLFDSEEKAKKYINGCNAYAIQEVQIA
jgi:hypothetical protein